MPFAPPAPNQSTTLLAGLTPNDFLERYWQKEPLMCAGALAGWQCPIDANDLAGLAMEDEAESRLIFGAGAEASAYSLKHGPFSEEVLTSLPTENWTLLVQGVEQWVPALAEMASPYRFLPDWRIDDIMVSAAAPGGSVGPHVDAYDVFLIQGQGTRTWHLGGPVGDDAPIADHPDLKLLEHFNTKRSFTLAPGDVLYVPPGHAHWGIAGESDDGDCLTLSLGFRAPSAIDLFEGMAGIVAEAPLIDRGRTPTDNPGAITGQDLDRLAGLLSVLVQDRSALLSIIGHWASLPKSEETLTALSTPIDPSDLTTVAESGLSIAPGRRLLYHQGDSGFRFFADGREIIVPLTAAPLAARLSDNRSLNAKDALAALAQAETRSFLEQLAWSGCLEKREDKA